MTPGTAELLRTERVTTAVVEAAAALVRSINDLTAVDASAAQHTDSTGTGDYADMVRALAYADDAMRPLLEGEAQRAAIEAANAPAAGVRPRAA